MNNSGKHVAKTRRPKSLKEVVDWGLEIGDMDLFSREFLDSFYIEQDYDKRFSMLNEEPVLTGDSKKDAYFAAMAEHLARQYKLKIPEWTTEKCRFLRRAYFPCGLQSLKATLIMESPIAFRKRMIFVDGNPLYRPRKDRPVMDFDDQ